MKMPEPMIPPTTTIVASKGPSARRKLNAGRINHSGSQIVRDNNDWEDVDDGWLLSLRHGKSRSGTHVDERGCEGPIRAAGGSPAQARCSRRRRAPSRSNAVRHLRARAPEPRTEGPALVLSPRDAGAARASGGRLRGGPLEDDPDAAGG